MPPHIILYFEFYIQLYYYELKFVNTHFKVRRFEFCLKLLAVSCLYNIHLGLLNVVILSVLRPTRSIVKISINVTYI